MVEIILQTRKQIQLLRKPERQKCLKILPYNIYSLQHWIRRWFIGAKPTFTAGAIHFMSLRLPTEGNGGSSAAAGLPQSDTAGSRAESLSHKQQLAAALLASKLYFISFEIVFHRVKEISCWDCQQHSALLQWLPLNSC